eukprot:1315999-Prymnesium_polylepis.2
MVQLGLQGEARGHQKRRRRLANVGEGPVRSLGADLVAPPLCLGLDRCVCGRLWRGECCCACCARVVHKRRESPELCVSLVTQKHAGKYQGPRACACRSYVWRRRCIRGRSTSSSQCKAFAVQATASVRRTASEMGRPRSASSHSVSSAT